MKTIPSSSKRLEILRGFALAVFSIATPMAIMGQSPTIVNLGNQAVDGTPISDTGYVDGNGEHIIGGYINDAFFRRSLASDDFGSGSGGFRDLYRLQDNSTASDPENGYNRNVFEDVHIPSGFDPVVRVGDLGTSSEGTAYVFTFDSHESTGGNNRWISLDNIRVIVGGATDPNTLPSTVGTLENLGTTVYEMSTPGQQNHVLVDSSLYSGSGQLDFYVFIPAELFAGYSADSLVYIYTSWGQYSSMGANRMAGFDTSATHEEIGSVGGGFSSFAPVPEASTALLSFLGIALLLKNRYPLGRAHIALQAVS